MQCKPLATYVESTIQHPLAGIDLSARNANDGDDAKRLSRLAEEWQQRAEFDGLREVTIEIARCGSFPEHVPRVPRYGDDENAPQRVVFPELSRDTETIQLRKADI
jgi:hypothetical protein